MSIFTLKLNSNQILITVFFFVCSIRYFQELLFMNCFYCQNHKTNHFLIIITKLLKMVKSCYRMIDLILCPGYSNCLRRLTLQFLYFHKLHKACQKIMNKTIGTPIHGGSVEKVRTKKGWKDIISQQAKLGFIESVRAKIFWKMRGKSKNTHQWKI